jgi:hypothetical protein
MCTAEEKLSLVFAPIDAFAARVLSRSLMYCQHRSEWIVWDDPLLKDSGPDAIPPVSLFMRCGWYPTQDMSMSLVISTIDVTRPSHGWLTAILAACDLVASSRQLDCLVVENVHNERLREALIAKGWSFCCASRSPDSLYRRAESSQSAYSRQN